MRITAAARWLGVSSAWLKNLERRGTIPRARRDVHGHRRYTDVDLKKIREAIFTRTEERRLASGRENSAGRTSTD